MKGGQRHAPAALPSGKNQYSLHRRLGGPQDGCEKSRLPQGFDPQTFQPVASRYTTTLSRSTQQRKAYR